ncbi:MAG TPA: GNAT family N-acetyltransferase [Candidatus Baltobacteraceae bacterium]|nr:GNAT family N-acetyltransferase [Candidatus Baltobacteraceae bacterium]
MQSGVQRLVRAHERAALAYLAQAPYDNVFLAWLIASDRSMVTRSSLYVYLDGRHTVRGVAFFGRQVVIASDGNEITDAFAEVAPSYRFERMIVGPRPVVERYWQGVRGWHTPPRRIRESQPVLAVDRSTLVRHPGAVTVRRAYPGEWEIVAQNSAKMIEHELEYDPRSVSAEFNANVRMMIDRGLWWVGESGGELCFICNAGPRSDYTLQLQGIWTPEHLRGRGLATLALSGVCGELLAETATLSLYVNGFNAPALRLYDRIGFKAVGEFATYLF